MKLEGKTIVITGGSSGIGLEVVKALAARNRLVVIAGRASLADEMRAIDPGIRAVRCDLADPARLEDAAGLILKTCGRIDVLINAAAVQDARTFLTDGFDGGSIRREIEINFTAVCRLSFLLLPALLKDDRSIILNVNSGLALAPKSTAAVYCATKAALDSFSVALGYQLEKTNVRVLQTFMPVVDTPMTRGRGAGKITAAEAARALIAGLAAEKPVTDVGKVRALRLLRGLCPPLARALMKRA